MNIERLTRKQNQKVNDEEENCFLLLKSVTI